MLRIKRFRLRDGFEPPLRVYWSLGHGVSLLQDWTHKDECDPESEIWDLDWFMVLDEDFCQPYTPFYDHLNDDIDEVGSECMCDIVKEYNRCMGLFPWLVEK